MIKTSEYKYCSFNFEYFNPVQEKLYDCFTQDCNIILNASVASGKTAIAEAVFAFELSKNNENKVVYVCPMKAIAEDKTKEWKKHNTFSLYDIITVSSESQATEEQISNARIIITTIEALCVKLRKQEEWIKNVSALAFDEAHLIGDDSRGSNSEYMIISMAEQNQNCRFILLSGTMSNTLEIAQWIKLLNNKKTQYLSSEWRPNKIEKDVITVNGLFDQQQKILKRINSNKDKKYLIFVHSKKVGEELSKFLKNNNVKNYFYHSGLTKNIRERFIENFSSNYSSYNVLITTTALSTGINL
jgi:replicative superfamily II helicase